MYCHIVLTKIDRNVYILHVLHELPNVCLLAKCALQKLENSSLALMKETLHSPSYVLTGLNDGLQVRFSLLHISKILIS